MQHAKCLAEGICTFYTVATLQVNSNSNHSSGGSSSIVVVLPLVEIKFFPRHMVLQLDFLQFLLKFIFRWDHGGPVVSSPTHSRRPLWNMIIPVRGTASLSSCAWREPKPLFWGAQDLVAETFRARYLSLDWAAFSLPPYSFYPSVPVSYPPGAKRESKHSSSWQCFRYLNKVIMCLQSILFYTRYSLRSFLHVAYIPGSSMSWLSVWRPGLKTLTPSMEEYRGQRTTCDLHCVFNNVAK